MSTQGKAIKRERAHFELNKPAFDHIAFDLRKGDVMKIGKFDATGLFVVQRTRAWGNGNKTICIKPSGFYLGSQAYKALDLVNNNEKRITALSNASMDLLNLKK